MSKSYVIHGQIKLPLEISPVRPDKILVRLEDISRSDAPSEIVVQSLFAPGELKEGALIPFNLNVPEEMIDQRHLYSVSVHVDISGSGEIELGDFITMQTYPVLTRGYGNEVQAIVKQV